MDYAQASSGGALVYTPDLDEPDLDKPNLDNNFSVETRDKMINKKLLKDISIELGGLELKSGGPSSYSDNKSLS
jgi:hypothetical protein